MMSVKCSLVVLAAMAVFASASPPKARGAEVEWGAVQAVSHSNLDFSKALFKVISKKPGNLIFSPTSIHVILAMTSLGARGDTAQQMIQGLHLPTDQQKVKNGFRHLTTTFQRSDLITTKMANRIFTDSRFTPKPEFVQTATNDFHSASEAVNFHQKHEEARTHINSWVMGQTENKISNLLPSGTVDASTVMVLVNALYFKGSWSRQFKKLTTAPKPFHVKAGVTKDVPMMYEFAKGDFAYTDSAALNAQILELPYQGYDVSMMIILPKDKNGLHDVETRLAGMSFRDLMSREVSHPHVKLYLPKFKVEHQEDLKTVLNKMGMSKMFTSQADFGGLLTGAQNLMVSNVLHKAFIEVDEEGTEAAAATAVSVGVASSGNFGPPPPEIIFKADHPFIFLLVNSQYKPVTFEREHTVLFMGRYAEPN